MHCNCLQEYSSTTSTTRYEILLSEVPRNHFNQRLQSQLSHLRSLSRALERESPGLPDVVERMPGPSTIPRSAEPSPCPTMENNCKNAGYWKSLSEIDFNLAKTTANASVLSLSKYCCPLAPERKTLVNTNAELY